MIVKSMFIGAVIGLVIGLFIGAPLERAVTGGILGIIIRKKLVGIFWR